MRTISKNFKFEYNFSEAYVMNDMLNLVCLEDDYKDINHLTVT